ncbi:MAG TPA: DUF1330 domain-containing protein [Sphingobium sp.]
MTTYMLFIREGEILDAEALATYSTMNRDNPRDPNLKPLIVYGAQEAFEGEAPNGVVLLEFPNAEAAKAWYNSPDYQAASEFRRKGANYRVVMLEGL